MTLKISAVHKTDNHYPKFYNIMKYITLLLICFTTQFILAQDADSYAKTMATFQTHYNTQNVDAIFDMYTTDLQAEMTKEGVTGFVKGCFGRFGRLKSMTPMKTEENVYSYNAGFEKSNLEIQVQINKEGKISTIQFHPIPASAEE